MRDLDNTDNEPWTFQTERKHLQYCVGHGYIGMENVMENPNEDNIEEKEGGARGKGGGGERGGDRGGGGGGGEEDAVERADLSVVGNESKKWPTPNDCHLAIATSLCGLLLMILAWSSSTISPSTPSS